MNLPQTMELFQPDEALVPTVPTRESLAPGAMLLRGWARHDAVALLADLETVLDQAPLRHMVTPGGYRMSVAMSNCGTLGWVSDSTGYRYVAVDPASGQYWPAMPVSFRQLARLAAVEAGFSGFDPDACLVNRYEPGSRLTLHQDRNERDFSQPIVSVSLDLPAVFLFGGPKRSDRPVRVPLMHARDCAGAACTDWQLPLQIDIAPGGVTLLRCLVADERRQMARLVRTGIGGIDPKPARRNIRLPARKTPTANARLSSFSAAAFWLAHLAGFRSRCHS